MKKILLGLLICSLTISLFAAEQQRLRIFPPDKPMIFRGLDNTSSPLAVETGRARDLQNVKFTSTYGLKKRNGYSLVLETLDDLNIAFPAITGIFDAHFSSATNRIFAFVGNEVKYNDGTHWTKVNNPSTDITAGNNNQFVFAMANDTVIATNDVDPPIELTSTPSISALKFTGLSNAITKAKCVAWFRNHLVFANTYENSIRYNTRIRWSNIGYTETYSDDDYIDIATNSGEEINAIAELYGDLYFFLDNSIWKVSYVGGDEVYVLSKVVSGIGCIAKNSVQTVTLPNNQMGIIFLDKNRTVYLFNGTTPIDLSANIETTMDTLNDSRLQYAVSTADGSSYYLCVSIAGNTTNDLLLEFDYSIGEWTKHIQIDANAMAQVETSTNVMRTYFGDYKSMVYWMDNTSLYSDVDGLVGTVSAVYQDANKTWQTATGLQVIVPTTTGLTVSALIGGIITIKSGTGSGQERVIADNTATGICVTTAFSTTPNSTSSFSIGAIDTYYTTKWENCGDPTRNKLFTHLYLWGEELTNVSHDISHSLDFGGILNTNTVNMSAASSALWDVAIWDTDIWGGLDALFKNEKLSGMGRFISLKFSEDDIDEDMNIYGYNIIYDALDVQ